MRWRLSLRSRNDSDFIRNRFPKQLASKMILTRDLLKRCDFALGSRTPCECTLSGLKTIVRLETGYLTRSTHLCNPLNLPKSLRLQDFDGSKSEVISITQQTGNDQTKISIQIWNSRNHQYPDRPLIRASWTTYQDRPFSEFFLYREKKASQWQKFGKSLNFGVKTCSSWKIL